MKNSVLRALGWGAAMCMLALVILCARSIAAIPTGAWGLHFSGDGAARLARYLNKQKQSGRWWSHSRNLKQPPKTVSERKVSRRRLSMIAADVYHDGRGILEALYPGYRLMECIVHYSDYVSGAYIYARMRRRD